MTRSSWAGVDQVSAIAAACSSMEHLTRFSITSMLFNSQNRFTVLSRTLTGSSNGPQPFFRLLKLEPNREPGNKHMRPEGCGAPNHVPPWFQATSRDDDAQAGFERIAIRRALGSPPAAHRNTGG